MKGKLLLIMVLFACTLLHAENRILIGSIAGFKLDRSTSTTIYGAGAGSKFKIIEDLGKDYVIEFVSIAQFKVDGAKANIKLYSLEDIQSVKTVSHKTLYRISKKDLPDYYHKFNSGFQAGILTVPFKLIIDNGEISPGATLGGFYGYKYKLFTILVSAGLASIPTSNINSGQIETKFGITGAMGVVFEPIDKFQLGLILGVDHLGSEWQYEDLPWLSLAIGFSFTE